MKKQKLLHVIFFLAGVAGAFFTQYFSGFDGTVLQHYGANFFFPFAIYFIVRTFHLQQFTAVLIALGGVLLQELGQLWGMYSGTFDFIDLITDFLGVLGALAIDRLIDTNADRKAHPAH
jgi:glycopeptide antibiotics resistance protein